MHPVFTRLSKLRPPVGRKVGVASMEDDRDCAALQYGPDFAASGIELFLLATWLRHRAEDNRAPYRLQENFPSYQAVSL